MVGHRRTQLFCVSTIWERMAWYPKGTPPLALGFQRGVGRQWRPQNVAHFEAPDRADRQEAASLWHTTLLAKSCVLHLGSGWCGKGAASKCGKHLFCGRRMHEWAWQLTVSAHPAQAYRGTNGVRSPSCSSDAFFKNYSYVKRAGTVQPSLFLLKFPSFFLALCWKRRILKSFCWQGSDFVVIYLNNLI